MTGYNDFAQVSTYKTHIKVTPIVLEENKVQTLLKCGKKNDEPESTFEAIR